MFVPIRWFLHVIFLWTAFAFLCLARTDAQLPSVIVAEDGPFRLLSTPQIAPPGLLATVLSLETTNSAHRIATIDNVAISGDVHQVWAEPFAMPTATPDEIVESPLFHGNWAVADTHLLIEPSMVGGGAGGNYYGISEFNDGSDPSQIASELPLSTAGFSPLVGMGELRSSHPTDAFFLSPVFQTGHVDIAYIVTPFADPLGAVRFTMGVQGGDELNLPIGPIDFHDVRIPDASFFPACDLDLDGLCDLTDLDALLMAVGTSEERFNLEPSPLPIDLDDVDKWLEIAGVTLSGRPYVRGDTDLDGDVDAGDLNNLALHWQVMTANSWQQGDLNADGRVDAADLNALGIHWQYGVDPAAAVSVPEPPGLTLLAIGLCVGGVMARGARQ